MKRLLTLKGGIALVAVAMFVAGGATYATHLVFDVNITSTAELIVSGDPIQIFSGDGVTRINSGDPLDFGTASVDFFGRGPVPVRGPFTVKNLSNGPVLVVVTGDGGDNIVPLWGPTTGDLKPAPDNAFTLAAPGITGDTMTGYLGLSFPVPNTGSKQTTIVFRATEEIVQVVYSNDFEGVVGPEWSNTSTDMTPTGDRSFLGQFSNDTVSLTLTDLPQHTDVAVSFDLFIIRSMDGNGDCCGGPEIFDLNVASGPTLLHTTFSNTGSVGNRQAYPDAILAATIQPVQALLRATRSGTPFTVTRSIGWVSPFHTRRVPLC